MNKFFKINLSFLLGFIFILSGCSNASNDSFIAKYHMNDGTMDINTTIHVENNKVYKQELTYDAVYSEFFIEGFTEERLSQFKERFAEFYTNSDGFSVETFYSESSFTINMVIEFDSSEPDKLPDVVGAYVKKDVNTIYPNFPDVDAYLLERDFIRIE